MKKLNFLVKPLVIFLFVLNINLLAFGYYFFVAKPNQEIQKSQIQSTEAIGRGEIKALCLNATLLPVEGSAEDNSSGTFEFLNKNSEFLEDKYNECIN